MAGDPADLQEHLLRSSLETLTPREGKMLTTSYDDSTPLPPGAETDLADSHPRLLALRQAYAKAAPVLNVHTQWDDTRMRARLNRRYFRGDSVYVWDLRELPRATTLKYFIFAQYLRGIDRHGLLDKLGEDGAFGCWTFEFLGVGRVSRDLLDSVNEILFLDRHLSILNRPALRVLDIGAGYGRLAHRMTQAIAGLKDYCCVDAIPDSTFLCDYYLRYRGCIPPARVVPLHELESEVRPGSFDLALNIHSFSECTRDAVAWWANWLQRLSVPYWLIVPNEPNEFLTTEANGSRYDYRPLIEAAGYVQAASEPVFNDPAIRNLMRINDHFFLFRLKS
ncbi:MAG: hypothetical protein ACRETN_04935 [Nevskiales bacterium]